MQSETSRFTFRGGTLSEPHTINMGHFQAVIRHFMDVKTKKAFVSEEQTDVSWTDEHHVCVSIQELCYYHGHIEGMEDSAVSVGICSGIR